MLLKYQSSCFLIPALAVLACIPVPKKTSVTEASKQQWHQEMEVARNVRFRPIIEEFIRRSERRLEDKAKLHRQFENIAGRIIVTNKPPVHDIAFGESRAAFEKTGPIDFQNFSRFFDRENFQIVKTYMFSNGVKKENLSLLLELFVKTGLNPPSTTSGMQHSDRSGLFVLPPAVPDLGRQMILMMSLISPLNAYGVEAQSLLAIATLSVMELLLDYETKSAIEAMRGGLADIPVFRDSDETNQMGSKEYPGLTRTMIEGILSVYQTLNIALQEKLPNNPDVYKLIEDLLKRSSERKNGTIARFASQSYSGIVGPYNRYSLRYSNPVIVRDPRSNEYRFSEEIEQRMKAIRTNNLPQRSTNIEDFPLSFLGCPLARLLPNSDQASSVQIINDHLLKIFLLVTEWASTRHVQPINGSKH